MVRTWIAHFSRLLNIGVQVVVGHLGFTTVHFIFCSTSKNQKQSNGREHSLIGIRRIFTPCAVLVVHWCYWASRIWSELIEFPIICWLDWLNLACLPACWLDRLNNKKQLSLPRLLTPWCLSSSSWLSMTAPDTMPVVILRSLRSDCFIIPLHLASNNECNTTLMFFAHHWDSKASNTHVENSERNSKCIFKTFLFLFDGYQRIEKICI